MLPKAREPLQILGPAEIEVLQTLWQHGPSTTRATWQAIRAQRAVASTTVATTMERLADKNLIAIVYGDHERVFSAVLTKAELMHLALERMFSDLEATPAERYQLAEMLFAE